MKTKANIRALQDKVGFDTNAAAELLSIVAEHVADDERLPPKTRAWFSKAVAAMKDATPSAEAEHSIEDLRAKALTTELGIVKRQGPPLKFVNMQDLRMSILMFGDDFSENELSKSVAEAYTVSLSTARTRIKEAKRDVAEARLWFDDVMAANCFDSLVRMRGAARPNPL